MRGGRLAGGSVPPAATAATTTAPSSTLDPAATAAATSAPTIARDDTDTDDNDVDELRRLLGQLEDGGGDGKINGGGRLTPQRGRKRATPTSADVPVGWSGIRVRRYADAQRADWFTFLQLFVGQTHAARAQRFWLFVPVVDQPLPAAAAAAAAASEPLLGLVAQLAALKAPPPPPPPTTPVKIERSGASAGSARFGASPSSFPVAAAVEAVGGGDDVAIDSGGVVYISPEYEAALATAHMWITARAPVTLGRAPIEAFVRASTSTTALQTRVRLQFLQLVVAAYNKSRQRASSSASKLATDAFSIVGDAEDALRWFELNVAFDPRSGGSFYQRPIGTAIGGGAAPRNCPSLGALLLCDNREPVRALQRIGW